MSEEESPTEEVSGLERERRYRALAREVREDFTWSAETATALALFSIAAELAIQNGGNGRGRHAPPVGGKP